jgi:mannonate dehydratase
LAKTITSQEKDELIDTIIVKTQGFINGNIREGEQHPVAVFKRLLANYKGIDKQQLRENLKYFLECVIPVADEYNVNLCVHPDDPPFAVLGLPRIVTNEEDIGWLLKTVDNPRNGLTFCAGSLSSGIHNDVPALARKFASRTHFVHLRSTDVLPNGDFIEASHLAGRADLKELIRIFNRCPELPMRVDHGPLMLSDIDKKYNPGYSFLGRMNAFAEVSGMMAALT